MAQSDRGASHFIPGGVNSLGRHDHDGHGALDDLLRVLDPFDQVWALVDDGRHQLRGVDIAAAHFQKMGGGGGKQFVDDLIGVVDLADGHDGKGAVVGADDQRLRFIVRNTADAHVAAHPFHFLVEFRPKGSVFDVVDGAVEPFLIVVDRHAGAPGPQMGVIVRSKIQVKYAIFL